MQILRRLNCADNELSILFVDDEGIREINKSYLQRDTPTNVIAFSMLDGECKDVNPSVLGDIIISTETAYRDAQKAGIEFPDEIEFLLIHGLLHLLGYDHENATAAEARKMKHLNKKLFFELRGYQLS
jgi:probable rRNA maturation factor